MVAFAPTGKRAYRYEDADNVRKLLKSLDGELVYPDVIVGTFGIMDDDRPITIDWKVSGARIDGKHGYVGEVAHFDRHTKSLLDSMFKGWE